MQTIYNYILNFSKLILFDYSLKVTRKIPSISVHLVEQDPSSSGGRGAESGGPPTSTATTRPHSASKTRKKRGRSFDQDRGQPQATACPDSQQDGLGQLSGLKLETRDAESAKGRSGGGGKGGHGGKGGGQREAGVKVQSTKVGDS